MRDYLYRQPVPVHSKTPFERRNNEWLVASDPLFLAPPSLSHERHAAQLAARLVLAPMISRLEVDGLTVGKEEEAA